MTNVAPSSKEILEAINNYNLANKTITLEVYDGIDNLKKSKLRKQYPKQIVKI